MGAVLGSISLTTSISWYLALERLIPFDSYSAMSVNIAWSAAFDSFCFWNMDLFFFIGYLILPFIQEGCLSSHKIILFGIKLWKMVSTVRLNKTTCPLIFSSKNRWTQSNWPVTQLNQFEPFHNPRLHEHKVADTQFQIKFAKHNLMMTVLVQWWMNITICN